jgi:hypothetical protein
MTLTDYAVLFVLFAGMLVSLAYLIQKLLDWGDDE